MKETIHQRMQVIIRPENWQDWLAEPVEKVERLVAAYTASEKAGS